jgi:RNA polymerase sigma-70 factor (ECF subfamily)
MRPPISQSDLETILDEADTAAVRLWRRLGLRRADLDDLRQDLLLDLIRRLPAFDANRGNIGAFAGIVLRNQSSRIAARVVRERRAWNGGLLSLDVPGSDGETLAEQLGENDGLSAWHGQGAADEAAIERRIDLARALGALQPRDRSLCAAATQCPVRVLAERGLGSRASLYRRIADLRCALAAHGLRVA